MEMKLKREKCIYLQCRGSIRNKRAINIHQNAINVGNLNCAPKPRTEEKLRDAGDAIINKMKQAVTGQ